MFKIGDYFEVRQNGSLGRIISISNDQIWVEWAAFPYKKYDYKKHEAIPHWDQTTKTFKGTIPVHPAGIMLSDTYPLNKNIPLTVNDKMLDFFESLLDDCTHDFVPYQGLNEAYDFCKHCNQKMPYKHLSFSKINS